VFASEWEFRRVVIEFRPVPLRRRMAGLACLRETGFLVLGIRGRVELSLVTIHAS
jgi:hypothetical protein